MELLRILDENVEGVLQLQQETQYAHADAALRSLLGAPRHLPLLTFQELLYEILPDDVCGPLVEAIRYFNVRFLSTDVQWNMDGTIATCLQLVRSANLLLAMIEHTQKLIDMQFNGPQDLDGDHRGWVAADYVHFLGGHTEFINDFNLFRARLLKIASRTSNDTKVVDTPGSVRPPGTAPRPARPDWPS